VKFSLLIPTRGRPDGLKCVIESALATASGEVEILVGVDADEDVQLPESVRRCTFHAKGSSEKTFHMARECHGDAMRIASNDEEFVTPGWDELLFDAWREDPLWCLYTNDKDGENTGGRAPCITREWYELVGYYPPHFWHWHADTWVTEVAEAAGRLRHVPEVSIVHHHPKARLGTGTMDAVYARRGPKEDALYRALAPERAKLVSRLVEATR